MGILATPSRQQPLDVDYINSIVTQVNTLTTMIGDRTNSSSNLNTVSVRSSDIKWFATTVNVSAATNNSAGDVVDYSFNFPAFKGIPTVVASIVSGTTTAKINESATVTVKNIGSQGATLRVRYYTNGTLNVNVNIIACGLSPD